MAVTLDRARTESIASLWQLESTGASGSRAVEMVSQLKVDELRVLRFL